MTCISTLPIKCIKWDLFQVYWLIYWMETLTNLIQTLGPVWKWPGRSRSQDCASNMSPSIKVRWKVKAMFIHKGVTIYNWTRDIAKDTIRRGLMSSFQFLLRNNLTYTCDTCDGFGISPWVAMDGCLLWWTHCHHLPVNAGHLQFGPCLEDVGLCSHESVIHLG